ncbi:GAF domain-containing protein [Azospirillum doebereinerae]|uniref:GAF domain-containing protein n=1 Tax=Azospirillum doebereinerae TaxID=92933 RepID=A0A433JBR3_9PROT|nr:GAF domain-containing protein [Azospirillum doebereinerae]MCG5239341.1 GAF domain-containing protein [Azospirillum doebereinerae]RUQ74030.1 GAF domain-containing protein [Azospirillum doebereinerae]
MDKTRAAVFGLRVGHATTGDVWKAACEDIVEDLGVFRASVWIFEDGQDLLVCRTIFDARERTHSSGQTLARADHPDYFRAITNNARLVVPDALNHPATKGFADGYFKQAGVRSLLDVILMHDTAPFGVLCCEQSGTMREWSAADMAYLQSLAMLLGTMLPASETSP